MVNLHPLQKEIIKRLTFSEGLRYKDLKFGLDIENNQLNFHLLALQKKELIQKYENIYSLTNNGKSFSQSEDFKNFENVQKTSIYVMLVCTKIKNFKTYYLLYTRKKHPYFGYQGFPAGKVIPGSTISSIASQRLTEETGLNGSSEIIGIHHVITYSGLQLIDDKHFYICKINQPEGELIGSEEGEYVWINENDLSNYLTKPFLDVKTIIETEKNFNNTITFTEFEQNLQEI